MSLKNKNITIFGGSGFLGTQLVRDLTQLGANIKVVCRRPDNARHLRVNGPTGKVVIQAGNIRNDVAVSSALENTDIAINLVGILFQHGKQRFEEVQAKGAERIARIASEKKVGKLISISALGVDTPGKSRYARSKIAGEKAVLDAFPKAVILRPSVIFGESDEFFNKFASILSIAPAFPLIGGGKTQFQPIYVGDVSKAICNAALDDKYSGKVFELGGPEVMTMKQVLEYTQKQIKSHCCLLPIPFSMASLMGSFIELLPNPPLTRDQVKLLHQNNVVSEDANTIKDLGIDQLVHVDLIAPKYLARYRKV